MSFFLSRPLLKRDSMHHTVTSSLTFSLFFSLSLTPPRMLNDTFTKCTQFHCVKVHMASDRTIFYSHDSGEWITLANARVRQCAFLNNRQNSNMLCHFVTANEQMEMWSSRNNCENTKCQVVHRMHYHSQIVFESKPWNLSQLVRMAHKANVRRHLKFKLLHIKRGIAIKMLKLLINATIASNTSETWSTMLPIVCRSNR